MKRFIEPEPSWKGSAENINYDCTLAFFAKQIDIKLWQAMAMMKYAERKVVLPFKKGENMGRVVVEIPDKTKKQFGEKCRLLGITCRSVVIKAIEKFISTKTKKGQPNRPPR